VPNSRHADPRPRDRHDRARPRRKLP